jgi:hypothetical protein
MQRRLLLFGVTTADQNRKSRIFLEAGVGERKPALQERRSSVGRNDPGVDATTAQAAITFDHVLESWFRLALLHSHEPCPDE